MCVWWCDVCVGQTAYPYDDVRYVYDDVTYVYDDVTYVYDDVTCVYDDVTYVLGRRHTHGLVTLRIRMCQKRPSIVSKET